MAKPRVQTTDNQAETPEDIKQTPEALYATTPLEVNRRKSKEKAREVRTFVEPIANKFIKVLGTSEDYDVVLVGPDLSGLRKPLFRARVEPVIDH
jgi:hypothetical protein